MVFIEDGIYNISFREKDDFIFHSIISMGKSFTLFDFPERLIIGFGKFPDNKAPYIRFVLIDKNQQNLRNAIFPSFQNILRNHASHVSFLSAGTVKNEPPEWIKYNKKYTYVDIVGYLPDINSKSYDRNILWMDRFLERIAETKAPAYVLVMIRPIWKVSDNEKENCSPLYRIKRVFELIPYKKQFNESIDESIKNKNTKKKKISLRKEIEECPDSSSVNYRRIGLKFASDAILSGAYYVNIRCVSENEALTRNVATMFWSCINQSSSQPTNEDYGIIPSDIKFIKNEEEFYESPLDILTTDNVNNSIDSSSAGKNVIIKKYGYFKRHGIDFLFFDPNVKNNKLSNEEIQDKIYKKLTEDEQVSDCIKKLHLHFQNEIIITGVRLPRIFQLHAFNNSLVHVSRGFHYCFTPKVSDKLDGDIYIGHILPSPIVEEKGIKYKLKRDNLSKHLLVVGSTGSGKTNTVVKILQSVSKYVKYTILEGAKREYRKYLDNEIRENRLKRYDLNEEFFEINIFEHPQIISKDSHISILSSIFESTLDLAPPLPAIIREALYDAYEEYHKEEDDVVKKMHPIGFWLMKSITRIISESNYAGEIRENIEAALNTRIRSLCIGNCGRILSGNVINKEIGASNMLFEFESIADIFSRSLIMSLFVVYYRYAVQEMHEKSESEDKKYNSEGIKNILVIEEAHRVIGKHMGPRISEYGSSYSSYLDYFSNLLSEIRAYNTGIIISDQSPSKLIDDAMRNTNTKIIMRLVSGDDISSVIEGAGLPKEAQTDIPILKEGQAIVVTPDNWCTLVKIDKCDKPVSIGIDEDRGGNSDTTNKEYPRIIKEYPRIIYEFIKKLSIPNSPNVRTILSDDLCNIILPFLDSHYHLLNIPNSSLDIMIEVNKKIKEKYGCNNQNILSIIENLLDEIRGKSREEIKEHIKKYYKDDKEKLNISREDMVFARNKYRYLFIAYLINYLVELQS